MNERLLILQYLEVKQQNLPSISGIHGFFKWRIWFKATLHGYFRRPMLLSSTLQSLLFTFWQVFIPKRSKRTNVFFTLFFIKLRKIYFSLTWRIVLFFGISARFNGWFTDKKSSGTLEGKGYFQVNHSLNAWRRVQSTSSCYSIHPPEGSSKGGICRLTILGLYWLWCNFGFIVGTGFGFIWGFFDVGVLKKISGLFVGLNLGSFYYTIVTRYTRLIYIILRFHPHTPGRYPANFTNSLWRNFLLCVGLGKCGVSSQGMWAKSLNYTYCGLDSCPLDAFPAKNCYCVLCFRVEAEGSGCVFEATELWPRSGKLGAPQGHVYPQEIAGLIKGNQWSIVP